MSVLQRRKVIRKSSSDLKSSASTRPGQLPHKAHMRLVCLEMERYRRAQEREYLLARAVRCEERCAAIDAEVGILMTALEQMRPRHLSQSSEATTRTISTNTMDLGADRPSNGTLNHSY